jgi:Bacterial Ig domain
LNIPGHLFRRPRRILLAASAAVLVLTAAPRAQPPAPSVNPDDVLYIVPLLASVNISMAHEIAELRSRVGEGRYVKVGFSSYIDVTMNDWNVDTTNAAAVRAALGDTVARIDAAIDAGRANGYPVNLNILTAIRERYDPVQQTSENEDRRSMQWYSDNALAGGWWSHSRYARKQLRVQEAYMRELGKILADRMARYPETLIAASGDGEVELSTARASSTNPELTVYADYSPFAVAEFRDWVRAGGLYAAGQPYAGQGYAGSARYAGDASPAIDSNGDGHTLNGDFGTSFDTWNLKYFDWTLADAETARAIPSTAPFDPNAVSNASGFDAPRVRGVKPADYFAQPAVDYWKLWLLFRSAMLQHHNTDVAKWITTSASTDAGTAGATVSRLRWSSYQIPGDYLFNGTPSNPNDRYESSGSSWTTADVSPYGVAGFTSFNINLGSGNAFVTLPNLAPAIADRNLRFSLLEWHPSVQAAAGAPVAENPALYSNELALVEKYRPNVVVPYIWNDTDLNRIQDTGFESMLRQLVTDLGDGLPPDPRLAIDPPATPAHMAQPFTLTGFAIDLGKVRGSGRDTGIDSISMRAVPAGGGAPIALGAATYGGLRSDVSATHGSQFGPSGLRQAVNGLPAGVYDFILSGHSTVTGLTTDGPATRITVAAGFSLNRTVLHFAAVRGAIGITSLTAAQDVLLTETGASLAWTATADQPWLQIAPASGSGSTAVSIAIDPANAPVSGTSSATVTFSAVGGGADPKSLAVTFVVSPASAATAPTGSFDTPVDGSTVSGSIAVTGWALDAVDVTRVEIWRDAHPADPPGALGTGIDGRAGKVFIGRATFVEGARPDVEAFAPNSPRSYRAGWGYIMLTRGLVWDGQGPFKLHAFAFNGDERIAALGSKTITINNAASIKPFGAIDTPGQGDTVSGLILNFGWVIAAPGRTISQQNVQVYVDGVLIGSPGGLSRRPDLDAAFGPLGFDTSQANRVIAIDTTQLANGVHTIGWLVTDDSGQADGVGSRFFRVQNTSQTVGSR